MRRSPMAPVHVDVPSVRKCLTATYKDNIQTLKTKRNHRPRRQGSTKQSNKGAFPFASRRDAALLAMACSEVSPRSHHASEQGCAVSSLAVAFRPLELPERPVAWPQCPTHSSSRALRHTIRPAPFGFGSDSRPRGQPCHASANAHINALVERGRIP